MMVIMASTTVTAVPEVSQTAIILIQTFEKCPVKPEWPGGGSGITLGYGCDIGADPLSLSAWKEYLSANDMARLENVKGMTGNAAKVALASVADITIPTSASEAVFKNYTLPNEIKTTIKGFPGCEKLPPDSFGALVSLVYNRGPSLSGDRRIEMQAIFDDLGQGRDAWIDIAVQIAAMTRLWEGMPTASNLPGRRLAEAALFAVGLRSTGLMRDAIIKGDSGDDVKRLQAVLKVGADGQFGTKTMVALWSYQGGSGSLAATGIADTATRAALGV
jgi:hypothetical protein